MTQTVTITIDGKSTELPVLAASEGKNVVDVRGLIAEGIFTYDPGFLSTASCDSKVTYIDGDAGILMYRGYPIEQLAQKSSHLEVSYLLLNGELPNQSEYDAFETSIKSHQSIDAKFQNIFNGFAQGAHPMSMVSAAIAGLAALYHEDTDITDASDRMTTAHRLIAKIPTLAAMAYKHGRDEAFIEPDPDLSYAENFLHMCFGTAGENSTVSPTIAGAMDRIFILHADHEQNASTSTVRMAGSTDCNPYAAIAAGACALWGPAHGGANEAVLNMLNEIGDESRVEEYVKKARDKDDPFKLMGFGHRVYKNFDPRATVMQESCHAVMAEQGVEDEPLLKIAQRLEKIAREDDYFIERKLYPNIDFYSGITLKAVGIPTELFTVIFTLGRMPGWITHWTEMLSAPYKIARPRQLYLGESARDYTGIASR
ncbi:MAG: citrate synthase [bacterium]|nr:citrate synthase [Gammaproteobacteria bacterium]HIL95639.1 citrate synthase [Pseudomonadales bacterium]